MKLFHYAANKYSTLKTLDKQGKVSRQEKKKAEQEWAEAQSKKLYTPPGLYFEHISFFLVKPPLDKMSTFFKDHDFWYKGHELYEHVVESSSIGSFAYKMTETPEKTELFYDDSITDDEFEKRVAKVMADKKYIGKDHAMFMTAVHNVGHDINKYFELIKKRPNFERINKKYAATVPHVMIYPTLGKITPSEINKVVIG